MISPMADAHGVQLLLAELDSVYRLAVFLAGAGEADDLVQETYLRALRTTTYKPTERGPRPWLFKILHNVLTDRRIRDRRRRDATRELAHETSTQGSDAGTADPPATALPGPAQPGPALPGVAEQYASIGDQATRGHATPADTTRGHRGPLVGLDWEQVDERLKHAIDELPLAFRTVFLLSAIGELRYREIAEVVDAPIGTVMSRLSRAREQLATRLAPLAAEHRLQPAMDGAAKPVDPPKRETAATLDSAAMLDGTATLAGAAAVDGAARLGGATARVGQAAGKPPHRPATPADPPGLTPDTAEHGPTAATGGTRETG